MRKTFLFGALLSLVFGTAAPADDLTSCLNEGPRAIPPIEAGKLALIEGRVDELFAAIDGAGLFRDEVRVNLVTELTRAIGTRPTVWCTLLQRNDFSDYHAGEVFMMHYAPDMFIYFAAYAVRQDRGWVTHSVSFNTDFSEMREHLR